MTTNPTEPTAQPASAEPMSQPAPVAQPMPTVAPAAQPAQAPATGNKFSIIGRGSQAIFGSSLIVSVVKNWLFESGSAMNKLFAGVAALLFIYGLYVLFTKDRKAGTANGWTYFWLVLSLFFAFIAGIGALLV